MKRTITTCDVCGKEIPHADRERRPRNKRYDLFCNRSEEIADCEIMLKQLKMINHCAEDVKIIRHEKVKRLYERLVK